MPRVYIRSNGADEPVGRLLYRIFLLSILFAVLWMKGYLWTAFIVAMLLYLFDTIVRSALPADSIEIPDVEPGPRRGSRRWKWKPEEPD